MNFSKLTLISAALFLGAVAGTPLASAETWTDNRQGDVTVTGDMEIVIGAGDAYTLNGSFLSSQESYIDALYGVYGGVPGAAVPDPDEWTITISGGGTLQYSGGAGSGYYTDNYILTRGDSLVGEFPEGILSAWKGFDSFLSAGNFTGTIEVSGNGTTLNLMGQLSQYVGLYVPNRKDVSVAAGLSVSELWGADIVLSDGATLSFEQSALNLSNSNLWQTPTASRVNALNFVKNLKSDASSKVVIGTDPGSHNRIVFYTDLEDKDVETEYHVIGGETLRVRSYTYSGEVSTIGRLCGNGRIYVMGDGAVAFIGQSELNPGNDTTGNTWAAGNRLADVVIDNQTAFIGTNIYADGGSVVRDGVSIMTDKEARDAAVDNVFAGATAVHFGAHNAQNIGTQSFTNTTPSVTAGAVDTVDSSWTTSGQGVAQRDVNVYGNQVFNNLQSLCLERSNLLSDADESSLLSSEPYIFSYKMGSTILLSTGGTTSIRVGGGSVLTINQDAYRDGWFTGELVTSLGNGTQEGAGEPYSGAGLNLGDNGDGLVVKTGKGKFFHELSSNWGDSRELTSRGTLSQLRIEDGTWVSSLAGIADANVQVVGDGVLELLVDAEKKQISTIVKGSGDLSLTRFVLIENDLTTESLSSFGQEGTTPDYRRYLVNYIDLYAAAVQFTTEQTQFTGSVVVNDGLTLALGEADGSENSPSIFSSAESIVLKGVNPEYSRYKACDANHRDLLGNYILQWYDGSSLQYSTLDVLSGVQLVKNLIGDSGYSRVNIAQGATLVLTRTMENTSFDGYISGNGNLINLGGAQRVRTTDQGDLFGTLSTLSGSVSVAQTQANAGFSGLVLANGGRVTFERGDGVAKVGMLVGEAGTSVSASGDFIVGDMQNSSGLSGKKGEYLATADYGAYGTYFTGTSRATFLQNLSDGATASRGGVHTNESTLAYLKNPANLIYTTDENVYDGAFSRLYATTGTDRNGGDVFSDMISGADARAKNATRHDFETGASSTTAGDTLFRGGETVAQWLRRVFKVEYVTDFINSSEAQLSASMKSSLLAMAQRIESGDEGVCAYLDGSRPATANLNVEGWNRLVAAGALEYLKAAYPDAGLDAMGDETLYSFITNFYPEDKTYEFVATARNLEQIETTYGVNFPANAGANGNYGSIVRTFGVESAEFAGTLSGSMNLRKTGAETLKLTGTSSYTGATIVDQGELYVDWNAIRNTAGVFVAQSALLTINGEKADIQKAHTDSETGRYLPGYNADSPGEMFASREARLSGEGVVLKLGDGDVDLGNALLGGAGQEFAGTFIVGEGGLIAKIDPKSSSAPGFGVVFNEDEADAARAKTTFRLNFLLDANDSAALKVAFGGEITGVDGAGTFILNAGTNNALSVAAEKFSPGAVKVESGDLELVFNDPSVDVNTGTYVLGKNSSLLVDLKAGEASLVGADIAGVGADVGAALRVSSEVAGGATLTLNDVTISNLSAIGLSGTAGLKITSVTEGPPGRIALSSLNTGDLTSLELGADREIKLEVAAGERSVVGGSFTGEGTFSFYGNDATEDKATGTLVLGNALAATAATEERGFSGEIVFKNGVIEMIAGENRTVKYTGLRISGDEGVGERTLVKSGAGTVWIAANGAGSNSIAPRDGFSMEVLDGTLAVGGGVLQVVPDSVKIEKGATLLLRDLEAGDVERVDFSVLSGAGTLAFEAAAGQTSDVQTNNDISADFTGVVEIGSGVTLTLRSEVRNFSAFAGSGTLNVESGSLTVTVDSNEDASQQFTGTITGLQELTVVGDGVLVLSGVPAGLTTVKVGSETQNGGFGTQAANAVEIEAVGAISRVALTDLNGVGGPFAGTVTVGSGVSSLELLTDGSIELGSTAVSDAFQLKTDDGEALELDGSVKVTLANVAGTELVLTNLSELGSEKFDLKTNAGGAIVFDGTPATTTYALRAFDVPSPDIAAGSSVWNGDIAGDGGVVVRNGANLRLNSSALSYTGATTVETGSTLIYGADGGAVSQSSGLEVASGATVVGGVRLVGEDTNVTFNAGSTFVFTGSAIEFTGTADVIGGRMNVVLSEDSLSVRGVPVALFRYIGTGDSGNMIEFDDLRISSEGGLSYFKESAMAGETGSTVIYVVAPDLANAGVKLHEGLSSNFVRMLNAITQTQNGELQSRVTFNGRDIVLTTGSGRTPTAAGLLAEAIIRTPNGSLAATLNNLSPLGYAAAPAMLQSGFLSDVSAISARIEQRRYDNYSSFVWETRNDWEFFVQGQGAMAESDSDTDTRTFDFNTYGAIAGADVKMSASSVAGFAVAYDFGKADLHDGGGDVESHDVRATAFFGKLFADRFYLDTGVQAGFATFDVKRDTLLGSADGDATGWHAGAFANVGMLIPLWLSEDEKTSVNLMPFVGLAYSHFGIGSFDESSAATALDTDSFDADSLRASVGASLAISFPWLGLNTRVNLDFAYTRELLDSETDIDYAMPGISGSEKFSVSAPTFAEDTFSFGPRISVDLDRNSSVYAGYRFEMSTDSDVSHSVNVGYRKRF